MKTPSLFRHAPVALSLAASLALLQDAEARGRSVNASREGPRGGSVSVEGQGYGRYRSGSVEASGPNGGSYEASGTRVGRYGAGSVEATGPNGGSYEASGVRTPRYSSGSVNATGPNGGTYQASGSVYRTGYVYAGGVYRPAAITVGSVYVAPVGVYSGWKVVAQPYYVTYPVYATYPVETSVQVELKKRGFYAGPIDGQVGPGTQKAIGAYQSKAGLQVTGTINQALLVSLGIAKA